MSAADDMGKLLKELIPYAINKFNLSKEDAEDIVYETGLKCLENIDDFDPSIASLKTWFIVRLKSQFLDKNKRSNIFKRVIKNTLKFNFTDRPEHLIENSFEEENRKEIKLKINPLRTSHNNRIKLQITTEKPHRANIGDLFQIKRLKDIDELIKKRLGESRQENKIIDIIDEFTFEVDIINNNNIEIDGGGSDAVIIFQKQYNVFSSDNTSNVLFSSFEENEIKIAMEQCFKRLSDKEYKVLNYNLGCKIECINCNDFKEVDIKVDPINKTTIYTCSSCNKVFQNQFKDEKPMTIQKIAHLMKMKSGTIGEYLATAKRKFADCMSNMEHANA